MDALTLVAEVLRIQMELQELEWVNPSYILHSCALETYLSGGIHLVE